MTSHSIRLLACLTMLCDHIGYSMQMYGLGSFDTAQALRCIGRLAMPLFIFLIAEGFKRTHNVFLYMLRIFIAALISEIPFNLACTGKIQAAYTQNVMFTLLFGLISLYFVDIIVKSKSKHMKCFAFVPVFIMCYLAHRLSTDYDYYAVLLILLFYFLDTSTLENRVWYLPALAVFAARYIIVGYWHGQPVNQWGITQLYELLCIIPIILYNGKKGFTPKSKSGRIFQRLGFYLFYPAHMTALYFIFQNWHKLVSLL